MLVWSGSEIYGTKLVVQTIIFKRNPKLPIVETDQVRVLSVFISINRVTVHGSEAPCLDQRLRNIRFVYCTLAFTVIRYSKGTYMHDISDIR